MISNVLFILYINAVFSLFLVGCVPHQSDKLFHLKPLSKIFLDEKSNCNIISQQKTIRFFAEHVCDKELPKYRDQFFDQREYLPCIGIYDSLYNLCEFDINDVHLNVSSEFKNASNFCHKASNIYSHVNYSYNGTEIKKWISALSKVMSDEEGCHNLCILHDDVNDLCSKMLTAATEYLRLKAIHKVKNTEEANGVNANGEYVNPIPKSIAKFLGIEPIIPVSDSNVKPSTHAQVSSTLSGANEESIKVEKTDIPKIQPQKDEKNLLPSMPMNITSSNNSTANASKDGSDTKSDLEANQGKGLAVSPAKIADPEVVDGETVSSTSPVSSDKQETIEEQPGYGTDENGSPPMVGGEAQSTLLGENEKPVDELEKPENEKPVDELEKPVVSVLDSDSRSPWPDNDFTLKKKFVDDSGDSYTFSYFATVAILCFVAYFLFHYKNKLLALALEGRKSRNSRGRGRPSSANYSKLHSNLEEAIVSNVSTPSATHVLY